MSTTESLRELAAIGSSAPPFDFDEFERRQSRAAGRHRAAVSGAVISIAMLGIVSLAAVVTQSPDPLQVAAVAPAVATPAFTARGVNEPALVDLGQLDMTSELEDHIAMLDAELSAARVLSAPTVQLQQMEATREQLNSSLQRVSYAHSLLSL